MNLAATFTCAAVGVLFRDVVLMSGCSQLTCSILTTLFFCWLISFWSGGYAHRCWLLLLPCFFSFSNFGMGRLIHHHLAIFLISNLLDFLDGCLLQL